MTATAILSNGAELLKPSKASPPVSSAIRWATGWMPPPVPEEISFLSSVGLMVSGPPQPPRPASTRTALYSAMRWNLLVPGCRLLAGVEAEAEQVGDHHRGRPGDHPGEQHRRHPDLDSLRLGLAQGQPDGDEVAADLGVDREQGGQRVLGRDLALADLHADQRADDLGDDRARPQQRRQHRQRADDAHQQQPAQAGGERRQVVGDELADPGGQDEADDQRDERHEGQDVADHHVDGFTPGLVERTDDPADGAADAVQQGVDRVHAHAPSGAGASPAVATSGSASRALRANMILLIVSVMMPRMKMTISPT